MTLEQDGALYIAKGNQNLIKAYTNSGVDSKLKQSNETG